MNDLKLLYVEDEQALKEKFKPLLQQYFAQVFIASDGLEALDLYKKYKPDVAVLDIKIPEFDGLQVAAQIRADNKDIQLVMLTRHYDQEQLLFAVNLQLSAYLLKDVHQSELDLAMRMVQEKCLSKNKNAVNNKVLKLAYDYSWDKQLQELYYADEKVKLTKNEQLVVSLLCQNPRRYFDAAYIVSNIFDEEHDDPDSNAAVQLLSRFKNKLLKKYPSEKFFIQNTYGAGYKVIL